MSSSSSSSEQQSGGWPELPPELLISISRSLTTISDYIRFRAVCTSWRSSTPSQPRHLPPQLPWLLSSHSSPSLQNYDSGHDDYGYNFYSLADGKIHSLPLPQSHQLFGSSDGYLVIRSPTNAISVLNPITGAHIHLPLLATFPMSPFFIKKVVLSPDPISPLALLGCSTLLAIAGDTSWNLLPGGSNFHDALHFRGRFHVVDGFKRIFLLDHHIDSDSLLVVVVVEVARVDLTRAPPFLGRGDKCYLVESAGELLLVVRNFSGRRSAAVVTEGFEVFRLGLEEPASAVRVDGLGDRMLFLGLSSSVSLSARDWPGFRGNCIYFLDDTLNSMGDLARGGGNDAGVFDMGDGTVRPLPYWNGDDISGVVRSRRRPAVWFTPSLR